MDYNNKLIVLSTLILITLGVLYSRSFKNDVPSCDGYITNVYLYILLALLITSFSIIFIAKRRYAITNTKSLLAFAIGLFALFSMYSLHPSQVLLNHLLWFVFILAISVSLFSVWRYSQFTGTVTTTLIIITIMVTTLTLLSYFTPNLVKLNWGTGLTIILFAGILAWTVPLFTQIYIPYYYKILSAGFVILFCILILYDTQLLRIKAQNCTIPNYPLDSLGIFIDIINLYTFLQN